MYTLYCRKGAGSMAVEALLAACGATYEAVDVIRHPDGTLDSSLTALNPRSEVPTLVLPDKSVMTESAAMMLYLADAHPAGGLAPALSSPERPQYLRWMTFMATALYMGDLHLYYPQRYTTRPAETDGIKERAAQSMESDMDILSGALGTKPFLLGDRMSAADVYAGMLLSWVPSMAETFARHPNLDALYRRITSVPAIRSVWERNETPVSS